MNSFSSKCNFYHYTCVNIGYLHEMVDHALIKILSPDMCVSTGRFHLKYTILDRQYRHVERTTPEVKHQHVMFPRELQGHNNIALGYS